MRHLPFTSLLLVLVTAVGVSAQATAPVDPTAALRAGREAEKAGILKSLAGYPILPPAKLRDVVILGLSQGHLTMQTRLAPTTMPSRLEISDLPGICTLTLHQVKVAGSAPGNLGQLPNAPYEPDLFLLERYWFDAPNSTVSCLTVEALPTSVQLDWSRESLTGISQVTLVDQVGPIGQGADRAPANIQFRALEQAPDGNDEDKRIELKAPDFLTLRREHPAEVEKYLGPIIRELRAQAILLPSDTVLAWQVFAPEVHPSPELIAAVEDDVKRLDADEYADREAARQSLEKIGGEAAIALSRLDRSKLSAEQTSVIDGIIKEFRPVSAETAKRLVDDPAFLLSCLTDTNDFIARTAFARLKSVTHLDAPFDFNTRDQARRDAVAKLRERLETTPK